MGKKKKPQPELSREEKKKLTLLEHYSDKDVKEMLDFIANNTKKEIEKTL